MRTYLVGLGLAMSAAAFTTLVAAEDGAPEKFRAEASVVDIGTVYAGSTGVAEFVFHNPTDRDVRILRAKPT